MVVTGFRHSVATSEAVKRDSNDIVEAISALDLGKLPDLSIAESLARLPGLAGQRVDGRVQVIAIRGLSPDFAGTTLNGREQVSTGDNRGVEFDQYPSELLSGAVVYKTPDARLLGQGLSGTIDLHTVRPLDYNEQRFMIGMRGEYNSLGDLTPNVSPWGKRFSVSYVGQFANNTIGVAFGFAHLDSPFQEEHYKAWWWYNTDLWGAPQAGKPSNAVALEGAEVWARAKNQVRDGLIGTIEYKPSDRFHSVLDLYYSTFDQKESMHGLMWTDDPWTSYDGGATHIGYTNVTTQNVQGTTLIYTGNWTGLRPVVRNDYNTRNDELESLGWKNDLTLGKWTGSLDLSYSGAKRNERTIETYAGSQNLDTMGFTIPAAPAFPTFTPGMSYSNPATIQLFDAQAWGHDGRIETPRQTDAIEAVRFDVTRDISDFFLSKIDAGVNYSVRTKQKTSSVYFANLLNNRAPVSVSSDLLQQPVSLGFAGIPSVLTYDVLGTLGKYYTQSLVMSPDDYRKDFTIKEKITTGYVMADIDTEVMGVAIRGNAGVQIVHTEQSSRAFDINSSTASPVGNLDIGTSYDDVLPSLNLVADFGEGSLVRLGVAKTMARPRVDDMRAAATAGVDPTQRTWSGNGGNPRLQPWRANSVDLSFEHYFDKASYVSAALFYKDLTSYIYTQNIQYDFTGYTNTSAVTPISNIGNYSTPQNGSGGYLRGIELSAALDGDLLSEMLDGFGILGSVSLTESNIKPDGPGTAANATLPGLSKTVANGTFYYEKNGFSFRVSERYRSDFRGEITTLFAQRSYTRILADAQTDLQVGYEFQEGPYEGLSFLFQVNNLTNSPYRTVQDSNFAGGGKAPLEYDLYGTQYLFGVNYKL
ncbi:MAG: TonB-dependent receptor [Alphaproteobacteria bacterium]|nr:TonB-dependent receptor [Alphaproteobacteria bacterium]